MGHDSSSPTKVMRLGNNKEIIPKLSLLGSKKPWKTGFEQDKNLLRKTGIMEVAGFRLQTMLPKPGVAFNFKGENHKDSPI